MTKRYLQMIQFVFIMGIVTSIVFVGMELWTAPLIAANAANEMRSAVLRANNITFNSGNINTIFQSEIDEVEIDGFTFFVSRATRNISFEFAGSGVWGPIEGVITIADDLETIVAISVLEQQETPGLGGIVATQGYLSQFVGIRFMPNIIINKPDGTANAANEVDSITGATRTSIAFEGILNEAYSTRQSALLRMGN